LDGTEAGDRKKKHLWIAKEDPNSGCCCSLDREKNEGNKTDERKKSVELKRGGKVRSEIISARRMLKQYPTYKEKK